MRVLLNMATTTINNKFIQYNLVFEKQIENAWGLKLLQ